MNTWTVQSSYLQHVITGLESVTDSENMVLLWSFNEGVKQQILAGFIQNLREL